MFFPSVNVSVGIFQLNAVLTLFPKVNFKLSDKVYEAMIDCLERGINETIVATISVFEQTKIDVVIRKPNFQKILSSYVDRLLEAENYEKLALIKSQIQKFDLEITK